MAKEIKLVVVDLDGTLLNSKHEMSEASEKALKDAMAQGVKVVLATGKTWASAKSIIERLGLDTPGIFIQGLAVYNSDGTVRHQQTLDPMVARRVLTFAEDRGYFMVAYSGSKLLTRYDHALSKELANYGEPEPEAIGPLQNILDELPVHKLIAFGEPKRINALRWQLNMQLDGQATFTQAQIPTMLEILPPGASKGKALRAVVKELGISLADTLAIGDGENDLELIEMVGVGVAVANASDKLKKLADHVVASNDEEGVAEAIRKYVLPPEEEKAPVVESEASATAETTEEKDSSE